MNAKLSIFASILVLATILPIHASFAQDKNAAPWFGDTFWGAPCKSLARGQGYGPYDYTLREKFKTELRLVEGSHFTAGSESLTKGTKQDDPAPDLDYTIRAFPNHHRALNSAIRLRLRKDQIYYHKAHLPPAECYLYRAVRFSPKDGVTYMLFGMLLQQLGQFEQALENYQRAEELQPENLNIKYNMGLLFVEMGQLENARRYAREIYAQKFPLPGLQRKIDAAGR